MPVWFVVAMMRVTTLKVPAAKVGGLLAYYAGLAEDRDRPGPARGPVDYYLDPDEPPGRWWGDGCAALGLAGPVDGADLRSLLEATDPRSGERLGRRFGDSSARGFDATFSPPKSVSVLWALSPDPWVRAEVLAAHDAAVDAAMGWFQRHGAVTRRGTDGVFQVDTLGITAALFRQHTSRTIDPQLHTHAVISAKVQDDTRGWFALDARFLKRQQRSIGWVYDAALRAELTERLSVGWCEHDGTVQDLACIPTELRDRFSERSAQVATKHTELIRQWSAEHGGADPDARTIASLERDAAKKSRPAKVHGIDSTALRAEWTDEAHRLGHDSAGLTAESIASGPRPTDRVRDDELVGEALRRSTEEASTWLRADLARHLATLAEAGRCPTAVALVDEIDRLAALAQQRCTSLGPERHDTSRHRADGRLITEHVTDRRLTTPGILHQEQELQDWAAQHARPVPMHADPPRAAALAIAGYDQLVVVVGPAGTGKTHTTAVAVGALQTRGRPVIGLAPSGKAADVLATEARCPTDTVAGFLTSHRHRPTAWPAGTTVILDEAGMTATEDLARLVDLVGQHEWRLVAVGDPEQLPSVGRGGVFAHWCDTVDHHTLDTPRRFANDWEAAASIALRSGKAEAVDAYAANGRLHTAHPALVASRVAHVHQRHVAAGRTVAITTNTAETARDINREIQWLTHPRARSGIDLHDGSTVHVGDTIATRRNDPTIHTDCGDKVRNRQTWQVTATHADGSVTATHSERGTVTLNGAYIARHVELGWAVTGYGNQGDTVDVGIAVLQPSTTRNHAYVAMTRGRQQNHALIVEPDDTTDLAAVLTDIVTRPSPGESALAVRDRLHHEAGTEAPGHVTSARTWPRQPAPDEPYPSERTPEQKVAAARALLDRVQYQAEREPDRSLGL